MKCESEASHHVRYCFVYTENNVGILKNVMIVIKINVEIMVWHSLDMTKNSVLNSSTVSDDFVKKIYSSLPENEKGPKHASRHHAHGELPIIIKSLWIHRWLPLHAEMNDEFSC